MGKSCVFICYLIGSVVKTVLYLHFFYTKDDRLKLKRNMSGATIVFYDVFTYCLNVKHFASLFFLTKDNFMF